MGLRGRRMPQERTHSNSDAPGPPWALLQQRAIQSRDTGPNGTTKTHTYSPFPSWALLPTVRPVHPSRRETGVGYSHIAWSCPFYVWDERQKIHCEAGVIMPPDRKMMSQYTRKYCANLPGWERCSLARCLLAHYDRQEERRRAEIMRKAPGQRRANKG